LQRLVALSRSIDLTWLAERLLAPASQMLHGVLFGVTVLNVMLDATNAAFRLINDRSRIETRP